LLCYVTYGELWAKLFEPFCLSEPGYITFISGVNKKYGTIVRVWVGPYLGVLLTEAKYVEVSKMALA
jgi:hypothetical protein